VRNYKALEAAVLKGRGIKPRQTSEVADAILAAVAVAASEPERATVDESIAAILDRLHERPDALQALQKLMDEARAAGA
jgi:hypothetical protein